VALALERRRAQRLMGYGGPGQMPALAREVAELLVSALRAFFLARVEA